MSNDDTTRDTGFQLDKPPTTTNPRDTLTVMHLSVDNAPRRQPRDNPPFDWGVTQRRLTEHVMSRMQAAERPGALQPGSRNFVVAAAMMVGVVLDEAELVELSSRFAQYRDDAPALRHEIGASRAAEWLMRELTREVPGQNLAPAAPEMSRVDVIAGVYEQAYADFLNSRGPKGVTRCVAKLMGVSEFGRVDGAYQALMDAPRETRATLIGQLTLLLDFFQPPGSQALVDPAGLKAAVESSAALTRSRVAPKPPTMRSNLIYSGMSSASPGAGTMNPWGGPEFNRLVDHVTALFTHYRAAGEWPGDAALIRFTAELFKLPIAETRVEHVAGELRGFHEEQRAEPRTDEVAARDLAVWLVKAVTNAGPPEPGEEPDQQFNLRKLFGDPDAVGTSAYRAAYDLLHDVSESARGCDEPFGNDEAILELCELEDVITSMRSRLSSGLSEPALDFGSSSANDLRLKGWRVAAHYDEPEDGPLRIHWLLVDENGWSVEGKGNSDAAALDQIRWAITAPKSFTVTLPDGEPEKLYGLSAFHVALDILGREHATVVADSGAPAFEPDR